jgi:hypothetical protein
MMNFFSTLLTLLTLIPLSLSATCQNGNILDANVRFADSSISLCLDLTSGNCSSPTFIPSLGHTCDLLYVDLFNGSVVASLNDFIDAGRCACIDAINGSLVIIIDINPTIVTEVILKVDILNFLKAFFYSVTNARLSVSNLNITYLFAYGDTYFELNVLDILKLNITLPELLGLTSINLLDILSIGQTNPCSAIDRALDILSVSVDLLNFRRRLFYWGFSTPDLTGCSAGGQSFSNLNIDVYALRQTIDVNLNGIESLFGDFTACNWFQLHLNVSLLLNDLIDVRLIIGSLSDFLCANFPSGSTTTTTPAPTQSAISGATNTKPPTALSTTASSTTTSSSTTASSTTSSPTTTASSTTSSSTTASSTASSSTTTTKASSTTASTTSSSSWWTPTTTTTTTQWWTTTTTRKTKPEWWRRP